jgi:redox-sensitive bicupin YhaK (pirin superfamily)
VINQIEFVIEPRTADIGIPVKRILPWVKKRMVGPFVFLDEMGPKLMKAPDEHMDVRPHPHIGLSTLTYLFEGAILHRDSLGVEQVIVPGEVNWMTAGRGISHSEREPVEVRSHDRKIHGLQFWVALPKELEDMEPSFHHYDKKDIPEFKTDSLDIKLVAGNAFGKTSGLHTHSPMIFMVMRAFSNGDFSYDQKDHEHALYITQGSLQIDGQSYTEGQMIVFKQGSEIEIKHSSDAIFVLIGGEVFPEPRFIWWNLVSTSREKIEAAKEAWRNRTFPQVPGDDEFIPLPESPATKTPDYP